MSTATPNSAGGYSITPIALFVLSTTMASATATAVAFMLFSSAQGEESPSCTCSCEAPEPVSAAGPAAAPEPVPPKPTATPEPAAAPEPVEFATDPIPQQSRNFDPDRKPPRVRMSKAEVKGSLDKDIIRRVTRAHVGEVRHCYNQGLEDDPELEGRVVIQFTISPTGKVPVAVVASSSLDHTATENCIAKAVKRWKFPKPKGGGNVVVTYPFVLQPAN